jgi:hypothetical protein
VNIGLPGLPVLGTLVIGLEPFRYKLLFLYLHFRLGSLSCICDISLHSSPLMVADILSKGSLY